MKRIMIMLAMVVAMSAVAGAEETKTESYWRKHLYLEAGMAATFQQKDTRVLGLDAALGCRWGGLSLFLQTRGNTALFSKGGTHTYRSMPNFGGGLALTLFTIECGNGYSYINLRGDITRNLGGKNRWRNTDYRVGLNWRLGSFKKFAPTIGMGYEFIESRTPGISSFGTAYATLSIWY